MITTIGKLVSGRARSLPGLIRYPLPIPLDPAVHDGVTVRGANDLLYTSNGFEWRALTDEARAAEIAAEVAADVLRPPPSEVIELSVGAGGTNASLGAAFNELRLYAGGQIRYTPEDTPSQDGSWAIIRILAGTVLAEQIQVTGLDLSGVYVYSDDPIVDVDASGFTEISSTEQAPFLRFAWSRSPFMQTMFRCINRGSVRATCAFGFSSEVTFGSGDWSNLPGGFTPPRIGAEDWTIGVHLTQGSFGNLAFADILDSVETGLRMDNSHAFCDAARIVGSGSFSMDVLASKVAIGTFNKTNFVGLPGSRNDFRKGVGASASDIRLLRGSEVLISSPDFFGGTSIPINTQRAEGVVRVTGGAPNQHEGVPILTSYTVATLPNPATTFVRGMVYVTNGAAGLPIMAFNDGTNWLRCDTRAPVSAT
jgi:hypothetical protein